jgi:hypothetical protein
MNTQYSHRSRQAELNCNNPMYYLAIEECLIGCLDAPQIIPSGQTILNVGVPYQSNFPRISIHYKGGK